MAVRLIRFFNIVLAALLAGTSFAIWIGYDPGELSAATYIELQQHTLRSLNVLMTSLVILATVITLVSASLQKNNKRVYKTLIVAAFFFISCIVISRFGNQPINDAVMSWTSNSFPENWRVLRDSWHQLHIARTMAELVALGLVAWVSIDNEA